MKFLIASLVALTFGVVAGLALHFAVPVAACNCCNCCEAGACRCGPDCGCCKKCGRVCGDPICPHSR